MQAMARAVLWRAPLRPASRFAWAAEPAELSTSPMDTVLAAASFPPSTGWRIGCDVSDRQAMLQGTSRRGKWRFSRSGLPIALAAATSF